MKTSPRKIHARSLTQRYSVRFLQLQLPKPDASAQAGSRLLSAQNGLSRPSLDAKHQPGVAASRSERVRGFELPRKVQVQPVKQTLVQLDAPKIVLKQDVPIPPVLLWEQKRAPPTPFRQFVAPPLREISKPRQSLPVVPQLDPLNGQVAVADLKLAAQITIPTPHLPQPAATTSPVRTLDSEQARKMPETVIPDSRSSVPASVISQPEIAVRATSLIALPPANQVAPAVNSEARPDAGAGGSSGALTTSETGMTRISLPKNGKFSVVVLGSASAGPYPESVGALSGQVIYTVYLPVGLKKNWILQYCLPKGSLPSTKAPLEPPWPFFMVRPDQLSPEDPDYVLVRGTITVAGRFDHLTTIFPAELANQSLLMSSLSLWEFRPANRDGEPTPVEVLFIIPRRAD